MTRGQVAALIGVGILAGAATGALWGTSADVRCDLVSDVDLAWFEGQTVRMLPLRRAGLDVRGSVRDGELVGVGDIGHGAAVVEVERARVVQTELVGRRGLRCREPLRLVPRSAEVSGVVEGGATHVQGCGTDAEVDPRDGSFFFYGEPGSCEVRACDDEGCGPAVPLRLEHEGSVDVRVAR